MKIAFILSMIIALQTSYAKSSNDKSSTFNLTVTEKGFEPSSINAKPGSDVLLKITRTTNYTCATEIVVPSKNIKKDLPLNKPVDVHVGVLEKGELKFGCGMNMMVGGVIFTK